MQTCAVLWLDQLIMAWVCHNKETHSWCDLHTVQMCSTNDTICMFLNQNPWAWDVFFFRLRPVPLKTLNPPAQPTQSNVLSLFVFDHSRFSFLWCSTAGCSFPLFLCRYLCLLLPPSLEHTLFLIVRDDSNDNNAKNHNSQPEREKEAERRRIFRWTQ